MYIEPYPRKNLRRAKQRKIFTSCMKTFPSKPKKWGKFRIGKITMLKHSFQHGYISSRVPGSSFVVQGPWQDLFHFLVRIYRFSFFFVTCILRSLLDEPPGWSSRDRCIPVCTHRYDLPNITCTSPVHRLTLL